MTQGGADREPRPFAGESLLTNPFAIVERIKALDVEGLEKFWRETPSFFSTGELTEEDRATLLRVKKTIKQETGANFVQWLQEGWREVDEKISAVPLGEEMQVPEMASGTTYSLAKRDLQLSETTAIGEEATEGDLRVVTLHHTPNDREWINVDFTVYGSDLRRVGFKTRTGRVDGFIELSDEEVRVRWQEVNDFSFELPVPQSAKAAS